MIVRTAASRALRTVMLEHSLARECDWLSIGCWRSIWNPETRRLRIPRGKR